MHRGWCLGVALALPALPAAAACPQATTTLDLRAAIATSDAAFLATDAAAFRLADDSVREGLLCVSELISPELAAAIHRAHAVRAFLDRELQGAELLFSAARRLDPLFDWPEDLVPAGHPLRAAYVGRDPAQITTTPVPTPDEGVVAFDGHLGAGRPQGVPTVFQLLNLDGTPRQTLLLQPYEEVPPYRARPLRRRRPLVVASVLTSVASLGLYAGAVASRRRYDDLDTPYGELDRLRAQTAILTWTATGVAVAAAGTTIAAVVQERSR